MEKKPPIGLDDLITHVRSMNPTGGPLQHLSAAMEVSEYLGELADHLIGHFVDQARRAGASWTEIGQGMGVTKQAAQKRFAPRGPTDASLPTAGVFARFTDRARNAVSRAQDEARSAGSPQVGPSHVVLGLVHEPQTLAGRCIGALGVPMDAVRAAARESLQAGENGAGEGESGDGNSGAGAAGEHVPFSAHSKKLLELTVREALRLGHNYVGTEHILLALLVDENAVLVGLGLTHSAAEQWLVATLDQARRSGGLR